MGTADQQDYADKEWFAQQPVPIPLHVQVIDFALLIIAGAVFVSGAFVALSLMVVPQ